MPVRRSKLNYQSVGGSLTSTKLGRLVRFDSLLERDFFLVLDLHPAVKWFEEQPMKVPWIDQTGTERVYVPDVLVKFRQGQRFLGRATGRPLLIELKYRDELGKNWDSLRPKLRAGVHAALERGCRFKILTEKQVRGIPLKNAEFIRKYLHSHSDNETENALKKRIALRTECTVEDLAASINPAGCVTREDLDCVWKLVANGVLSVGIEAPISPCSMVFTACHDDEH